jgi:hypothetical protein
MMLKIFAATLAIPGLSTASSSKLMARSVVFHPSGSDGHRNFGSPIRVTRWLTRTSTCKGDLGDGQHCCTQVLLVEKTANMDDVVCAEKPD